jgi:hypothetical protein
MEAFTNILVFGLTVSSVTTIVLAAEYACGNPVLDMHFHSRATPEADLLHLEGSGETMAVLVTRAPRQLGIANGAAGKYLSRFFLFTSVDVTRQDAIDILRKTGIAGT